MVNNIIADQLSSLSAWVYLFIWFNLTAPKHYSPISKCEIKCKLLYGFKNVLMDGLCCKQGHGARNRLIYSQVAFRHAWPLNTNTKWDTMSLFYFSFFFFFCLSHSSALLYTNYRHLLGLIGLIGLVFSFCGDNSIQLMCF